MEPAFQRGDLLFLTNKEDPIRVGEIVVFKVEGREIPIVHRVLKIHEKWVWSFTSSLNFINILNVKYLASIWILISKVGSNNFYCTYSIEGFHFLLEES